MTGVFDLREVGRAGMVDGVVDCDDLVIDEIANSGLWKGDKRYVRTAKWVSYLTVTVWKDPVGKETVELAKG